MTYAINLRSIPQRERCPKPFCAEACDEAKDSPHTEHAHFIGATMHEHRWTT